MSGPLGLDENTLASCVQCGLCLPHCPTWRVTGEEIRSPRGRIDAMRDVEGGEELDAGFVEAIGSCVGCRSCEGACPSGVQYGELLAATTEALADSDGPGRVSRWQRVGLSMLDRPRVVRAGTALAAVAQRLGLAGRGPLRNVPRLPIRQPALHSTGEDVVLLTGCVMDATQRRVHAAAVSVLAAAGFGVRLQPGGGCCGALAAHRGLAALSERQVAGLARSLPPAVPVLSDSAGCGAAILEAACGPDCDPAVADLAGRTSDISTFLLEHIDRLDLPAVPHGRAVAITQPCHLRNVQGIDASEAVVELLSRFVDVRRTDDDDLCCGAGGSHSVLRPDEAALIRDRKVAALDATGADVVASANPGCAMHLEAGGMLVSHPVEILAIVLDGNW